MSSKYLFRAVLCIGLAVLAIAGAALAFPAPDIVAPATYSYVPVQAATMVTAYVWALAMAVIVAILVVEVLRSARQDFAKARMYRSRLLMREPHPLIS